MEPAGDADYHSHKNTDNDAAIGEKIQRKINTAVIKIIIKLNQMIIFNAKGNQEKKNNYQSRCLYIAFHFPLLR